MQFLIDANCFMEVVRSRPQAEVVRRLLIEIPGARLAISDFTLHALGVVMWRHKILDQLPALIQDVDIGGDVAVLALTAGEMAAVVAASHAHHLDFDDAYQYVAAELHNLRVVSLDIDFDRTPNGRLAPGAALQLFRDEQSRSQQGT